MQAKTTAAENVKGILALNAENYKVPQGEEHLYHCRIEVKKFSADSGERQSKPRIQKFGKKYFETNGLHYLKKQGYTVDILHDPKEWVKEQAEQAEARKAEQAAKAAAAAEERAKAAAEQAAKQREAEKEAMKAEILAQLRAEGVIPQAVTDNGGNAGKTTKK